MLRKKKKKGGGRGGFYVYGGEKVRGKERKKKHGIGEKKIVLFVFWSKV